MYKSPISGSIDMLTLENVHAHYGLSHVLQGVTLKIERGGVLGLFGRNGAGKTTILRTVAGWLKPSSGSISLDRQSIAGLTPDAICRRGVGFVPEDRRIFPGLTVEENLRLGFLQVWTRSKGENEARLAAIYARFPRLAARRRQFGTTLSGGEQQMLAIARVLAGEPKLLLIDEPTEGLSPQIADEIFSLLTELKAQGETIVLVEQNARRALEVADVILAIERGRVVYAGNGAEPTHRQELMRTISV
jgi:branched-chain amino acid transport system ATP-binding protein